MSQSKSEQLLLLAEKRRQSTFDGYYNLRDFHDGIYDFNYVFPWSKPAHNEDADVVVVAQDWDSSTNLEKEPDKEVVRLGHNPKLDTNINLKRLLVQHLGMDFAVTYAIEVFPFIKKGNMSARIPFRHLTRTARDFAIPVIEIVKPKLVVCLGLNTFN